MEQPPRRRLIRNDELGSGLDELDDDIPSAHAPRSTTSTRRKSQVVESDDEDEDDKGEGKDEWEDDLDNLDDADMAAEEVAKAWKRARDDDDDDEEDEEEEEEEEDDDEVVVVDDDDEDFIDEDEDEEGVEEEEEEEEEEGGEASAASRPNTRRSSGAAASSSVPRGHLWCSICKKHAHPDNFSQAQKRDSVSDDERFCLKHTGTSGFGRTYEKPKPPSDSGSEAEEESPRAGIIRDDKDEEVEEGEEEVNAPRHTPRTPPVRNCQDCGAPIDPRAEVWKTRCLDCWKNMRDSARKMEREQRE